MVRGTVAASYSATGPPLAHGKGFRGAAPPPSAVPGLGAQGHRLGACVIEPILVTSRSGRATTPGGNGSRQAGRLLSARLLRRHRVGALLPRRRRRPLRE